MENSNILWVMLQEICELEIINKYGIIYDKTMGIIYEN